MSKTHDFQWKPNVRVASQIVERFNIWDLKKERNFNAVYLNFHWVNGSWTRGFELVTRRFELVTCVFELELLKFNSSFWAFNSRLATRNSQLVTRVLSRISRMDAISNYNLNIIFLQIIATLLDSLSYGTRVSLLWCVSR